MSLRIRNGLVFLGIFLLTPVSFIRPKWLFLASNFLFHSSIKHSRLGRYARVNLRVFLPGLSNSERKALLDKLFTNACYGVIDFMLSFLWPGSKWKKEMFTIKGGEAFIEAVRQDKNIILFGAHYTAIELQTISAAVHFPEIGPKLHIVGRLKEQQIEYRMIFSKRRRMFKNGVGGVINRDNRASLAQALKKKGVILYFTTDHTAAFKSTTIAPFFGIPIPTVNIIPRLAKMADAVAFHIYIYRVSLDPLRYEVGYVPVHFESEESLPGQVAIMNQAIEASVRRCPEQYATFYYPQLRYNPDYAPLYRAHSASKEEDSS